MYKLLYTIRTRSESHVSVFHISLLFYALRLFFIIDTANGIYHYYTIPFSKVLKNHLRADDVA